MKRKTLVLPAVIGLLTPVLAACGGSDGGDGDGAAIVVGTTDKFTVSEEAPAPLDPAYAYDVGTWNIMRHSFQTLMAQPRGEGEPEPDAAESCRFTDSGNERYACKLREGLSFSDGTAVTAEDVKFSFDRVLSIKDESGVYGLLSTIELVEAKGDREVIFHLTAPDATLPFKLSTPAASIVNPEDYAKDKVRAGVEVDGSGPYTLKAEVEGGELAKIVFTKNPHYKGIFTPKNDKVELRAFDDSEAMGAAIESGDIQVMTRSMTPDQIDKLAKANGKIDLVETSGLEIRYLGFNTDAESVKTTAVRQAMAQLIDRGRLVSEVYGTQASPLFSLIPAGVTGHSNAFFNLYGEPDRGKAEELLTEAGISTPVKLTMHYTTDHYGAATKQEFEELQRQLNDSGLFDVDIKGTPWATFRPAEMKGEYDVYGMGWFPDFPDADSYTAPFLDEANMLGSPYNNKDIRKTLIPESRRAADRLNATDSFNKIQDIVAEDVPVLPLWQGKQYLAARDGITGAEWAINSSAVLQLWELGRGVTG